uniref:Replication-associated protein ORF2/G2P domain-containing protein n=1 Tax=uncultured prokaryote TaxID=198431 RepID=A0A0H5QL81_9ZZZZ|nr:hypothetical protein [uncultured prokaryote]
MVPDGTHGINDAGCPGASDGRHDLFVVGYVRGPREDRLDCFKPLRVVCRSTRCDYRTAWACNRHSAANCPTCAQRYKRRLDRVALSGLNKHDGGYLYFLTLTAPGDEAHADQNGIDCPCTPAGGIDLGAWNASHSRRWNHFRTSLRQQVPQLEFFRGIEVQHRGALHDHCLVWSPVPITTKSVRVHALRAGFGHSIKHARIVAGSSDEARYVTKYTTKSVDQRTDVPWTVDVVDQVTGEITTEEVDGRYRTWSMSRGWGTRMADVKAAIAAHMQRARAIEADREPLASPGIQAEGLGQLATLGRPPP